MSAAEIYDYVSTVTPDYSTTTLNVSPQEVIAEGFDKNQSCHDFDNNSRRVISYSDDNIIDLTYQWSKGINESDAGIILDFWADAAKANGRARSFKLYHKMDGHTYVVMFKDKLSRNWPYSLSKIRYLQFPSVTFKVIGRIADA